MRKLEYKNPINWAIAIIFPIPLLIFSIVVITLLLSIIIDKDIFSKTNYFEFLVVFLAFVVFILWMWLWNTFGKTILIFNSEEVEVKKKFNIFYKKKKYQKKSINKILIRDRNIEKKQYYIRINGLFSDENQCIALKMNDGKIIKIIDWLNNSTAENFKKELQKYLEE
ncbi:hypothetical protein SAMN05421847_2650 [Halpernia humi]|uniref:Photosystem I assembly protein Ycf4 n=1 Tax=Halpernia humi TaxID=493375 RepID=A0A1H6B1D7_9FLAO|nr:hypothetical protein [Halpernia humi]SEG54619.1 hypothetical protein SAMN05421847_2650 [Halpernia humi]